MKNLDLILKIGNMIWKEKKNNTSRRYEANTKNPIGSGYTGGSSGK